MKVSLKIWLMILSGFILQGCFYEYWLDGCVGGIEGTLCYGDSRATPAIAQFQKPNTIGHTDAEQRWKDVEACGGTRKEGTYDIGSVYGYDAFNKFVNCMKSKGYVYLSDGRCSTVRYAKKNGCNLTNEQPDFKDF